MMRQRDTCDQVRRWHVFLDYRKACECCRKDDPDLRRCRHRPQAEVRTDSKEND